MRFRFQPLISTPGLVRLSFGNCGKAGWAVFGTVIYANQPLSADVSLFILENGVKQLVASASGFYFIGDLIQNATYQLLIKPPKNSGLENFWLDIKPSLFNCEN